ncbi:MAG: prohibitin family protein [Alphaproteobacteria bacterium]|nr:prohibitin family protein [Alphaproteobacteria bacterium]
MSNIFTPRTGNPNRLPSGFPNFLSVPLVILIVVALIVFLMWPFKTIDQGDVGVKLRWGQAVEVLYPGINIVVPGMEHVVLLPTRTQKFTPPPLNSYSKDTQVADVKVSVNYHVDPTKAIEVYSRYGATFVESIINPIVNKRFKEVFGRYDSREIVNKRKELGEEVESAISKSIPSGIIIETVQIENIDFSDTYEAAIEGAAQAEAAVRKAKQELEQKKVDAERVVVQATADATARITAAKADADAIRLKGEAEASAIQAKAAALRDNPGYVGLTAAEKWDGKLPTTFVPGSALPFVQVPR